MTRYFISQIDYIGQSVIGVARYTLQIFLTIYLSIRATLYDQAQGLRAVIGVVSAQIYFTGWQAVPLMTVLALAVGGVAILESTIQLSLLGNTQVFGELLVVVVIREVGPLLTALIVIARSGTAVASELGNMRVNREIEALEVMGINPLSYIVFPRVVGGVISLVCLSIYFSFVAIFGGFIVSSLVQDLTFTFFAETISHTLTIHDLYISFFKNVLNGAIIFVVSCYQGLSVGNSPHEVPQQTTKAVLNSITYVIVFNLLFSAMTYFNQLLRLGVL